MTVHPNNLPRMMNMTLDAATQRMEELQLLLQQQLQLESNPDTNRRVEEIHLELQQLQQYCEAYTTRLHTDLERSRSISQHQVEEARRENLRRELARLQEAHNRGSIDTHSQARMFDIQQELRAQAPDTRRDRGRNAPMRRNYVAREDAGIRGRQLYQELLGLSALEERNIPVSQDRVFELQFELHSLSEQHPDLDFSQVPMEEDRPIDTQQPPIETQQPQPRVENLEQSNTPVIPQWAAELRSGVEELQQRYPNSRLFGRRAPAETTPRSVDRQQPPPNTQLHIDRTRSHAPMNDIYTTVEMAGMRMVQIQQELRQLDLEENTPVTQERILELRIEHQHLVDRYPDIRISDEVPAESTPIVTQQPETPIITQQPTAQATGNVEQSEARVIPDWGVELRSGVESVRERYPVLFRVSSRTESRSVDAQPPTGTNISIGQTPRTESRPVDTQPPTATNTSIGQTPMETRSVGAQQLPPDTNTRQNPSRIQPTIDLGRVRARKMEIIQELIELEEDREAMRKRTLTLEKAIKYLEQRYPNNPQVPIDTQQHQAMEVDTEQVTEVAAQQPTVETRVENVEQSETRVIPDWGVELRSGVEELRRRYSNRIYLLGLLPASREVNLEQPSVNVQPPTDPQQPSAETQPPIETQPQSVENLRPSGLEQEYLEQRTDPNSVMLQPQQELSRDQELCMDSPINDPRERRVLRVAKRKQVEKEMRKMKRRIKRRKPSRTKERVPASMYCPKPLRRLLRPSVDTQPSADVQQPSAETQPIETQPSVGAQVSVDVQPLAVEIQPAVDIQPPIETQASVDVQQASVDVQQPSVDTQPPADVQVPVDVQPLVDTQPQSMENLAPRGSNDPGEIDPDPFEFEPEDYDHESFHRDYVQYEPPPTPDHLAGDFPSLRNDSNRGIQRPAQNNAQNYPTVEFRFDPEFEMYLNRFVEYALSCPPNENGCIVPSPEVIDQIIDSGTVEDYAERLMDNCPRAIWIRANGVPRYQLSHICDDFYCCTLGHMVDEPYHTQLERLGCQGTIMDGVLRIEICRHTPRCTRVTLFPRLPVIHKKRMSARERRVLRVAKRKQVEKEMRKIKRRMKRRKPSRPKRRVPPSMYCPKPLRRLLRHNRL